MKTGDALLLDFDGTIADIVVDPAQARAPESTLADIRALARLLGGAVAIISGRAVEDLARRTPPEVWRIGSHGTELLAPGEPPPPRFDQTPPEIRALQAKVLARWPKVMIERKPFGFAAHSRAVPEAHPALLEFVSDSLAYVKDWRVQRGKLVVDVLPTRAHKGTATIELLEREVFRGRRPILFGDDLTDESAMGVVRERGGEAVKVGPGPTLAGHRTPDPDGVRGWLARARAELEAKLGAELGASLEAELETEIEGGARA